LQQEQFPRATIFYSLDRYVGGDMLLSEQDIERFDKLHLKNIETVGAAIGAAAILHWEHIPMNVRDMIVRTADLIEPICKHPGDA
jgi:hypothetical protein